MEFSTIVLLVIVAGVAYTFYKAFSKKETIAEAIKEEVAEVKAVEAKVEQEVKAVATKAKTAAKTTATKAKTAVKKATARKPQAVK
jgi:outer membrane murein-binding lipoprotein Lpp